MCFDTNQSEQTKVTAKDNTDVAILKDQLSRLPKYWVVKQQRGFIPYLEVIAFLNRIRESIEKTTEKKWGGIHAKYYGYSTKGVASSKETDHTLPTIAMNTAILSQLHPDTIILTSEEVIRRINNLEVKKEAIPVVEINYGIAEKLAKLPTTWCVKSIVGNAKWEEVIQFINKVIEFKDGAKDNYMGDLTDRYYCITEEERYRYTRTSLTPPEGSTVFSIEELLGIINDSSTKAELKFGELKFSDLAEFRDSVDHVWATRRFVAYLPGQHTNDYTCLATDKPYDSFDSTIEYNTEFYIHSRRVQKYHIVLTIEQSGTSDEVDISNSSDEEILKLIREARSK